MPGDELTLKAALRRLSAVVAEIVTAIEANSTVRCPYKTTDLLCTSRGGCLNQRREESHVRCDGDSFLVRNLP